MRLADKSVIRLVKEKESLLMQVAEMRANLKTAKHSILQMEHDYEILLVYAEDCNVDVDDFRQALADDDCKSDCESYGSFFS